LPLYDSDSAALIIEGNFGGVAVKAADLVVQGISGAIAAKTVTYDFHRLMEGATLRKCSEFGEDIVQHMG